MPTLSVLMPQLGESVVEGTVSKWLKQEGDPVREFEPLLEVTTDKVDTEVPAPAAGVILKLLAAPGVTVKAGTPIALIGQPEAEPAAAGPASGQTAASAPSTPAAPLNPGRLGRGELGFISPVVAKLAQEHALDLKQISGTGLGGRITKQDVLKFLETRSVTPSPQLPNPPAPQFPAPPPSAPLLPRARVPSADSVIPVEGLRKQIAEHMAHSVRTAPHVTTVFEADLTQVLAHQAAHKAEFARAGVKLTLTPYFLGAVCTGLRAVPVVNSQWVEAAAGAQIVVKPELNLGVAVALDEGLIVPVIRQADEKSLLGLARAVNDLAGRARAKALKPDEVQGGTFTLTNHGVSGSLFATPIIHQPQSAILGLGAVQKRVGVVSVAGQDALVIRPMVYLSLTFDHRVLDGATADQFMRVVKTALEEWA